MPPKLAVADLLHTPRVSENQLSPHEVLPLSNPLLFHAVLCKLDQKLAFVGLRPSGNHAAAAVIFVKVVSNPSSSHLHRLDVLLLIHFAPNRQTYSLN
jgi:hypothetical protein